jgi:hypothetical protein
LLSVAGAAAGFFLTRPRDEGFVPMIGTVAIFGILGVLFSLIAGVAYPTVLMTRCFTSDFSRPIWNAYRTKRFFAKIAVEAPGIIGATFLLTAGIGFVLGAGGVPLPWAVAVPGIVTLLLMNFVTFWFDVLSPVERALTRARMAAMGVTEEEAARAELMGTSDPAPRSGLRFGPIEDDIGMLWFEDDRLVYRGDRDAFSVTRENLLAIERGVDPQNTSAYFGAVDVILRLRGADGRERRVRLHPESCWTLTGIARAKEDLARRLETWRDRPEELVRVID